MAATDDRRLAAVLAPSMAVLAVALVVSRRIDAFTRPQFWAEDGTFWFAAAYNYGPWNALQTPAGGYYQTFARLTAAASLPFGLGHAPLVFALAALLVQVLPPLFLLSSRFARSIPDIRLRALAALLIIGAPNGFEIQSNVTNAQTHLALLGFLIVVADQPRRTWWTALDVVGLAFAGLAGPTCVLLAPVALLVWWRAPASTPDERARRARHAMLLVTVVVVALVQASAIVTNGPETRIATPLGVSLRRLLILIGGQIVFAGALGEHAYRYFYPAGTEDSLLLPLLGLLVIAVAVRAAIVARIPLVPRALLFGTLVLAAALASPVVGSEPRWRTLQGPGVGGRYWALPILAYLALVLWTSFADPRAPARWAGRVVLAAVLLIGLPLDWRVEPRPDLRFADHVLLFERAPRGAIVKIPIPPSGWEMTLHKR